MREMGLDHDMAGRTVLDLRDERPELSMAPVAPMVLEPGVNSQGVPFIGLHLLKNGKREQRGQLDCRQAKHHAMSVMEVVAGADFDGSYLRYLKGTCGVEDPIARAAVGGLAQYQQDATYRGGPDDGEEHSDA
jgi:hypothetical protein